MKKKNMKYCNKCDKKGDMENVKTMAIHTHFPFYAYESFYLCDECLNEFQLNFIKWIKNDTSNKC